MKGVRHFGIKGKLAPRYIGPYPILDKYGPTSYQVELPAKLSGVRNVFHVSHRAAVERVTAPAHTLFPRITGCLFGWAGPPGRAW
jgi:hypothetical protein